MISQLRKSHLTIWTILAVLLPAGFVVAILNIPPSAIQSPSTRIPPALSTVLTSQETPELKLNRRTAAQAGQQQLEIIIKQPLTSASALIYLATDSQATEAQQGILLGKLGSKGIYRFAVPASQSAEKGWKVMLYDKIKGQTIQTILL